MDTQLIIEALTAALDIETGHQWTSDPIPTDLFNKPATLVLVATPSAQAPGGPVNLEDLLADAVDLYEGKSFTTDTFVIAVPAPGGANNFAVTATYTVTGQAPVGGAEPQPQAEKKATPGGPGTVTKVAP